MGAIFEFEGVVVEDCAEEHRQARRLRKDHVSCLSGSCTSPSLTPALPQAWLSLAEELGKSPPPAYMLKKAVGMKSAQVRRGIWRRSERFASSGAAARTSLMD